MTSAKAYGLKALFAVVAGGVTGASAAANYIASQSILPTLPTVALGVAALASLGFAVHFAARCEDAAASRPQKPPASGAQAGASQNL